MKTGDIILVRSNSKRADKIAKFQQKADKESGYWTHSGLLISVNDVLFVVEQDIKNGFKFKATTIFTPFDEYEEKDIEFKIIQHTFDEKVSKTLEGIILDYVGTPYDYFNLILFQPIRTLFGKWIGGSKHRDKRMICHEFVMTVWNQTIGIFPDCYEGKISDIYYSKYFEH